MTEKDDWDFPRPNHIIDVDFNGEQIQFKYSNTTLFRFMGAWAIADHIYRVNEERTGGAYYFGNPEFMEYLDKEGFPLRRDPYPSVTDVQAFREWQGRQLEYELGQFIEGED